MPYKSVNTYNCIDICVSGCDLTWLLFDQNREIVFLQMLLWLRQLHGDGHLLVLLWISKSCKRMDSGEFVKNPQIRIRFRILDERIATACDSVCQLGHGTERQMYFDTWAGLPTSHPISHPRRLPVIWLCNHVKSSETDPSLTPSQTVLTLDTAIDYRCQSLQARQADVIV